MKLLILLTIILILLIFLLNPLKTHADELEPDMGNLFVCGQHALAAEMRHHPFEALLEGARVLRGKGMCFRDASWLSSWGVAQHQMQSDAYNCISYYACRAYFLYDTIDPAVREPIALAVHVALTEDPPVLRFHFDSANAPISYWWYSPRACPNGFFVIDKMRFC